MKWQDIVFSVGAVAFLFAIVGSIRSPIQKPPRASCALTAFFLWLFVGVYASYELWISVGTGILSASAWTILFFQKRAS